MAIVQNPITGRTKKKFGTAVFAKQFGKNTMRTKPIEVKNPRTTGQVNQRNKFALMVSEGRKVNIMLKVSFQNMALEMTPFNVFIKQNIKTAITGAPGSYAIDYSLLKIAKGPLLKTSGFHAGAELAKSVKRTWTPPIDPLDPANNDLLYVAAYNEDKSEWYYSKTAVIRATGLHQQTVPDSWVSDTVHVYSFFVSPDGSQSSDGDYSGTVVII